MEKIRQRSINAAESILLVGTFFMTMYIFKNLVSIFEVSHFFEARSWWFLLPAITFVLFLHSYLNREDIK